MLRVLEKEVCGNVYGVLLHFGSEGRVSQCQEEGNRDYDTVRMVQNIAKHPPGHLNTSCHPSRATLCLSGTSFSIRWEFLPTL